MAPTPPPPWQSHQIGTAQPQPQQNRTYAGVTKHKRSVPCLKPVALIHRPITYVDNIPAILFTSVEDQLCRQRENTLIMKFSAGKPRCEYIRAHIAEAWNLETQPVVGYMDPRHVTLNMASPEDTKRALSPPTNKINNSLFWLFRWTPDFEIGKESSFVAVWVKFFNLPLHYYNEASLHRLGSILGNVLRVDNNTLDLVHQVYARVCIELDVSQKFQDKLWIRTSKEHGWLIDVEYEGNHAYCSYCGLLGHTQGLCRKKRQIQGKGQVETNPNDTTVPAVNGKIGNKEKGQWIPKQKTNSQHTENDPKEILKKPEGVDEATRQRLLQVGLLSESENGKETNTCEGPEKTTVKVNSHDEHREPGQETLKSGQDNESEDLTLTPQSSAGKKMKTTQVRVQASGSGVVRTPTKKRFDGLDTENELNKVFKICKNRSQT